MTVATADSLAPPLTNAATPAWPGPPQPFVHPDRMSMLGALHGMTTTPITEARVLELGCRDGENLLALAATWPTTLFTGVEPDVGLARAAAERVAMAGLANVTLMSGTLAALAAPTADALGTYDYVIAHGLLSRSAPADREALWTIIATVLAPSGVALVSFDTWPGHHMTEPLRRLMAFHVAEIPDPEARVIQARAIAHWQAERWFRVHGPMRQVLLQRQLAEVDAMSDDEVARELLPAEHHPLTLEDFVADAARHGLQWLTNARASEPRSGRAHEQVRQVVAAFPDVIRQQQYLDYFVDTHLRTSLVCHGAHDIRRQADVDDFVPLFAAPRADYVEPEDDPQLSQAARRLLAHLTATYTVPLPLGDVVTSAIEAQVLDDRVATLVAAIELFFADAIELARIPPPLAARTPAPDELPRASAWALVQAQSGARTATSLWHREVALLDGERRALALCDGAHATDQIVELLGPEASDALAALHRHGFLLAGRA